MDGTEKSRSWFCVLNNPEKYFSGTPEEMAEKALAAWCDFAPDRRTGAVAYAVSADGLHHLHLVLCDNNTASFTAVKATFPKAHIEATKGTKAQAEAYITKQGIFQETGEKVLYTARRGEIKGRQGERTDLKEAIPGYIEQGLTPKEIYDISFWYRKYDRMIRDAYYQKRFDETPPFREVRVRWHVGEPGTGKSHTYIKLCEQEGRENIYFVKDFKNGFDKYYGEPILFLDELRSKDEKNYQLPFDSLLSILDGYTAQVACRYTNIYGLWTSVEITSVLPPESIYDNAVLNHKEYDSFEQLRRRIDVIVYHWTENGEYCEREFPMADYTDYSAMLNGFGIDINELLGPTYEPPESPSANLFSTPAPTVVPPTVHKSFGDFLDDL